MRQTWGRRKTFLVPLCLHRAAAANVSNYPAEFACAGLFCSVLEGLDSLTDESVSQQPQPWKNTKSSLGFHHKNKLCHAEGE